MRWPLTENDRQICVAKLMQIIRGDDIPCVIRAMRVILEMESQNVADETTGAAELRNRIAKILENLRTADGTEN